MTKPLWLPAAALLLLAAAPAFAQSTSDPCTGDFCGGGFACVASNCVDDGKLMVTLSWTTNTDLDIYLQTPSGAVISSDLGDALRADGGELRRDECYREADCEDSTGHPNIEHIVWDWNESLPVGDYEVWVKNFNGLAAADFTINVTSFAGEVATFTTTIPASEDTDSARFGFAIDSDTVCDGDMDRDGICDKWEREGIDIDEDGTVDLDLPNMGADPERKDLFIEVDRLAGETVFPLGNVVAAFASAPVDNPDGSTGITMHVTIDEEVTDINGTAIMTGHSFDHTNIGLVKFGTNTIDDDTNSCSAGHFGTAADRSDANCANIIKAKRQIYRYGIYAAEYALYPGSSGIGELPGDDFVVSVGSWGSNNTQSVQEGTFMHELGHTLGLRHGGSDDYNCKPNFLSIMSYYYQFESGYAGRPLAYSENQLATLDESALVEADGVSGPASWAQVIFQDATGAMVATKTDASQPIDWNQDMDSMDTVSAKVSNGNVCNWNGTMPTTLTSHNDWDAVVYDVKATPGFNSSFAGANGSGAPMPEEEVDEEGYEEMASQSDSDDDGLSNLDDNCATVPNADQADADGDDVGDACDECPQDAAPGFRNGCPGALNGEEPTDGPDGTNNGDGGGDTNNTTGGDGGNNTTGGGDGGDDEDGDDNGQIQVDDKGCSTTGGGGADLSWFGLLIGFGFVRRRRRRG